MQFYKRPGSKYWWFKFVHRTVRYQQSIKQTKRRKAEEIAAAFCLRLLEGELNVKRKQAAPAFNVAMANFLEWSKEQHAAHPNTTRRYSIAAKSLSHFFGNALLDSITPEDVERYRKQRARLKSEWTGRKLRPATIYREAHPIVEH